MTPLKRAVVRVSAMIERGRPVIIRLEEGGKLIRFRLKGTRRWYTTSVGQCYWSAVANYAQELAMAKAKAREERKRNK